MNPLFLAPILYVEDEEDDVMLMRIAFKQAGVERPLTIASDGREALEYLFGNGHFSDRARHPFPYLVLLDLNLPQLSGLEVLQRIRQEPRWNNLPVIVFSSSQKASDRERAQELGASNYVTKPSTMKLLMEFADDLRNRWLSPCA